MHVETFPSDAHCCVLLTCQLLTKLYNDALIMDLAQGGGYSCTDVVAAGSGRTSASTGTLAITWWNFGRT